MINLPGPSDRGVVVASRVLAAQPASAGCDSPSVTAAALALATAPTPELPPKYELRWEWRYRVWHRAIRKSAHRTAYPSIYAGPYVFPNGEPGPHDDAYGFRMSFEHQTFSPAPTYVVRGNAWDFRHHPLSRQDFQAAQDAWERDEDAREEKRRRGEPYEPYQEHQEEVAPPAVPQEVLRYRNERRRYHRQRIYRAERRGWSWDLFWHLWGRRDELKNPHLLRDMAPDQLAKVWEELTDDYAFKLGHFRHLRETGASQPA